MSIHYHSETRLSLGLADPKGQSSPDPQGPHIIFTMDVSYIVKDYERVIYQMVDGVGD